MVQTKTAATGLSVSVMKTLPSHPNHKWILVARNVGMAQLEVSDKHPHTHAQSQAECVNGPKL